jgi:hypothetical protein
MSVYRLHARSPILNHHSVEDVSKHDSEINLENRQPSNNCTEIDLCMPFMAWPDPRRIQSQFLNLKIDTVEIWLKYSLYAARYSGDRVT